MGKDTSGISSSSFSTSASEDYWGIGRGPRYLPYLKVPYSQALQVLYLSPKPIATLTKPSSFDNLASGLWILDHGFWLLAFGFWLSSFRSFDTLVAVVAGPRTSVYHLQSTNPHPHANHKASRVPYLTLPYLNHTLRLLLPPCRAKHSAKKLKS